MIVRTVTAVCDVKGCDVTRELSPATHQPFRDLLEHNWTNWIDGDDILLACPKHPHVLEPTWRKR